MNRARVNLFKYKQQAWVYVVGCLFVADFAFYGYLPAHRRLQTLDQAQRQNTRLIETARSQQLALPGLRQRLAATEEAVAHYEQSIPTEGSLVAFQRQITEIMTENALTDQVIVPQAEIEAGQLNCIPVRMNCKGSLEGIFGFCRQLRTMDRLVRIENLRLKNDTDYTGQVSLEAEAVVFYRSEKVQAHQTADNMVRREAQSDDA